MPQLTDFFKAIEQDARVGVSHISLYCALFQLAILQESDTVYFNSYELMGMAKISGSATYHRCMKSLHEYGYIMYRPSYNHHRKKSRVIIQNFEKENKGV